MDAYKCPNCGRSPLQLKEIEIEADVTDDVLFCENCGKLFEMVPGKEIKISEDKSEKGKKNLCLVPTGDTVELCRFDGTFREGEGMSMGKPVKWKYPKNAYPFKTMGRLSQYNSKIGDWVREALQTPGAKNEIYVDGLPGHTGWWNKDGPR